MKKVIIVGLVSVAVVGITLANLKTDETKITSTTVKEQPSASNRAESVNKPLAPNKNETPHDLVSTNVRPHQKVLVETKVAARKINKELERRIIEAGGNPDQLIKPRSDKELAL